MKKILGIDIGVASIGWAYILESNSSDEESKIIQTGVRIIPLNSDAKQNFTKGISYSPNQIRRQKRTMRRNLQRYRLRRHLLHKLLTQHGLAPTPLLFGLSAVELYQLRSRALNEQISLPELGRIWYHLNQKRGYRSSRKSDITETKKQGDYLQAISQRKAILIEKGWTVGQYFAEQLSKNPHYRIKQQIFPRECYMAEFDRIWSVQAIYYPNVLTETLLNEIRNRVIYYQRPLKSQKDSVAECRFFPNHKVAPKSSPAFQVFKIWQNLNALRIEQKSGEMLDLTLSQRKQLFIKLNNSDRLSATDVLKELGLKPREYKLNFEKLEGNRTRTLLLKAFVEAQIQRPELLDFDPYDNPDHQPFYRLWHVLYSIDEPEHLIATLQKAPFQFSESEAKTLIKVGFKAEFSNISTRAIRKILPYLEQGMVYSEACEQAGFRHSDFMTKAENMERVLADSLAVMKPNSLRNPTVEKITNQLINLVNTILKDPNLGRPDEIRVELGRELKQNAEQRNRTYKNNNERDRERQKIEEILKEHGVRKPTTSLIEKYRLWEETGKISLYTGNPITLAAILQGEIDVEHIIPKARIFDDSFINKTLCERHLNEAKGDQTAHDFMKSLGEMIFDAYCERVALAYERKDGISKAKRERLLMAATDIPQDFVARQLRETQYIALMVKDLLSNICYQIHTSTGAVTSHLRHIWGLDSVLQNLNFEKYAAAGRAYVEHNKIVIEGWSKRDDHRHHAIDALIVACTKQGYIQRLNKLNQQLPQRYEAKESAWKFPMPWPHFVRDARNSIAQILVSFKAGKKVATLSRNAKTGQVSYAPRGPLHEESIYGRIKQGEQSKYVIKYTLGKDFDLKKAETIVDKRVRDVVKKRLQDFDNDTVKAFKEPLWFNESLEIPIRAVRCFARLNEATPLHFNQDHHATAFVKLGSNHHVAIYQDENGKRFEQTVTFWEAVERLRDGQPIIRHTHENGAKLLVSLQQNQMFIFGLDYYQLQEAISSHNYSLLSQHLYRVQSIAAGDYWFRHHTETQNDKTELAKTVKKYIRLSLSSMNGIKIHTNPLGKIVKIGE